MLWTARFVSASLLTVCLLLLGGCPPNPADCQRQLCEAMAIGDSTVISAARGCCSEETPAARDSCKTALNDKLFAMRTKILELKSACETNNRELYKRLWDEFITLVKGAAKRTALLNGQYVNPVPLLFADDSARLRITFGPAIASATVETVIVGGKNVLPAAAGNAVARESARTGQSNVTATFIGKENVAAPLVSTYPFASAGADLYIRGTNMSIAGQGSISIGPRTTSNGVTSAIIGGFTASASFAGQQATVTLDETFEGNTVVYSGNSARVTLAVKLKTTSEALAYWQDLYEGTVLTFAISVDPQTGAPLTTETRWLRGTELAPIHASDLTRNFAAVDPADTCSKWIEDLKKDFLALRAQLGCNPPAGTEPRAR